MRGAVKCLQREVGDEFRLHVVEKKMRFSPRVFGSESWDFSRFVDGILKGIYVVKTLLHVTLAGTVSGRQRQRIEVRSQGFFFRMIHGSVQVESQLILLCWYIIARQCHTNCTRRGLSWDGSGSDIGFMKRIHVFSWCRSCIETRNSVAFSCTRPTAEPLATLRNQDATEREGLGISW